MAEKNWWESAPLAETPQSNNSNDDWYKSAPLANQDQTQPQGLSPLGNNDWSGYEGGPQITQADLDLFRNLGSLGQSIEKDLGDPNADPDAIKEKVAAYKSEINDMLLNSQGKSLAEDRALYTAMRSALAYDLAAAYGQKGQGLSDKETQRFIRRFLVIKCIIIVKIE